MILTTQRALTSPGLQGSFSRTRALSALMVFLLLGIIQLLPANLAYGQPTDTKPGTVQPVAGEQLKPMCEITIEYWNEHCPGCETVRAFLPALQSEFPCVSIGTEVKSTPVVGGYPRAKNNGTVYNGPDAIKKLIESMATACGCGKPQKGSCVCKKWTTGERGYACVPKDQMNKDVTGTLPGCDAVEDCAMNWEECDTLRQPGLCEILDCKGERSPRCQIKKDTESEDCDGKCSTVCGGGDKPLLPTTSLPGEDDPAGDEPETCVPNCNDKDCCAVVSCKDHEACRDAPNKAQQPPLTREVAIID